MKLQAAIAGAVVVLAMSLCAASARAQSAEACAVPGYLLFGDSPLDRVGAAVAKDRALRIVVLGGSSSTLPGPDGAAFAYPARLEAALRGCRRTPPRGVTSSHERRHRQAARRS